MKKRRYWKRKTKVEVAVCLMLRNEKGLKLRWNGIFIERIDK
jgi:hypothetical protein